LYTHVLVAGPAAPAVPSDTLTAACHSSDPGIACRLVWDVTHSTGAAMWQEPSWREVILEKPEVWGVQTLYTDAVLLRIVARTAPLRQWEVQRELTERLKNSLDATDLGDSAAGASGPDGNGSLAPAPGAPTAETAGKAGHRGHVT
jgi:hypothetical protein